MIPRGFAHGFLVLSDTAEFVYKCDEFYHPEDEGGIMYNDKDVNIIWPEIDKEIELSAKDKLHPSLKESKIEF
jgi:dTDP-4-dehydrorhamnose 3,5-epimerase